MSTRIAVLGSTGSIGTHTLEIVDQFPGRYEVASLTAGKNITLLKEQIAKYNPKKVCTADPQPNLESEFPGVEFLHGQQGLCECASDANADRVVVGVLGFAALAPTLAAIRARKTIALANKESLVAAGPLMKSEIKESGAHVIPVDSEHNALYQLLEKVERSQVRTMVITASGGPLLRKPDLPLEDVTPEIAIKHPNWSMGPKISVDSATLMNKGLELIETHYLFDIAPDDIEVWVHPQSLIHGALWMTDNTCMAQINKPNMKASIGYALAYPDRLDSVVDKLAFADMAKMEFLEPDHTRFPTLGYAREAMKAGCPSLIALNAANEIAVQRFLEGRLLFSDIFRVLENALETCPKVAINSLDDVFDFNEESRRRALEKASGMSPGAS